MTNAPDIVYIGPAMDADGKPTWGGDWVQIGDWDTSLDGLTFAEHGKRFVDADLHADLLRAADELADAVDQERNMVCQDFGMQLKASEVVDAALTAYRKVKENPK